MPSYTTKEDIDEAVSQREIARLAALVRDEKLPHEVRDHLAKTISDLLSRKINFPRRRPRGQTIWGRMGIAEEVWQLKYSKGWKKTSAAIKQVAEQRGCSVRSVWGCWAGYEKWKEQIKREDMEFDAALDAA